MQGWFDGHPEIGKMQKDIFDDIFDTKDDDVTDDDDPAPLVPTPTDFQVKIINKFYADPDGAFFLNKNPDRAFFLHKDSQSIHDLDKK